MRTAFRSRAATAAALLILAGACTECSTEPSGLPAAVSYVNVAYGTNPTQVMDINLPAGRTSATAVVVFIHGGGWSSGDKSIFTAADLKKFTDAGFATVNINYRLASNTANIHDPVLSDDVTAALDFIAANAAEYQVAGARFGLVGHSAGAHLALLAGYKYNASNRIKAVASLAGPTDLNDAAFLAIPTIRATVELYLGVTQAADPARWTAASPLSVATANSPPTIIFHGQLDVLVPHNVAEKLHLRLGSLAVATNYHFFPTYNHDLAYAAINHFPDAVWNPTVAWFNQYVK